MEEGEIIQKYKQRRRSHSRNRGDIYRRRRRSDSYENKKRSKDKRSRSRIRNKELQVPQLSPTEKEEEDSTDIFSLEKNSSLDIEKQKEERRLRIQRIQEQFRTKEFHNQKDNDPYNKEVNQSISSYPSKDKLHVEDLAHLAEKERTKMNSGVDPDKQLEFPIKAESPTTPDMFASSPVTKTTKKSLAFQLDLHSHGESTGYYIPQVNEVINERYQVLGICGKGIFSTVIKVLDLKTNSTRALKMIRAIDIMIMSGEKERSLLKKLNDEDKSDSSHIIRMIDTFDYNRHICFVFDLYEMNLRELLKSKNDKGFPLSTVRSYAKQMIRAFILIHKFHIIHADFKPDNTIVNKSLDYIRICDFGSAMYEDEIVITSELVSRYYRAPEIILGSPYDTKIDIWALGCTLFELYTGKVLFPGKSNNDMIRLIMQTKGKFSNKLLKRGQFSNLYFINDSTFLSKEQDPYLKTEYIKEINCNQFPTKDIGQLLKNSKEDQNSLSRFVDFLEKCLNLDPNKRISALEAFSHPFLEILPSFQFK